jgi:multidrug efflux system membrane fusion protein
MTRQKFKPVLITAGLAVALVAWLWLRPAGGDKQDKGRHADAPVAVKVTAVARQDIPVRIKAVGTVMPFQTVAVRSRIDSQLMEVKFHDGDTVKAGDVLFILDDRTLKAQHVQTQANLERDKAQLDNAKRQYDRLAELGKRGFASRADQDNARAAYATAQANVAADEAALENIGVQLGYTTITAPIGGRTGTISVTVGNNVKANDVPLVTINQIRPILVQASLPQDSFDSVRSAMQAGPVPASASRTGAEEAEKGTLAYIDNAIDQATGTFVVRASFDNENEHLWPGMLGALTLDVGMRKDALTVPEVAIQHAGEETFVYVIADGKAHRKDVNVTQSQDQIAVIGHGLEAGEQVAVDGMLSLQDGSNVTVDGGKPGTPPATEGKPG